MKNAWKTVLAGILVIAIAAFCVACFNGRTDVKDRNGDKKTSSESSTTSGIEDSDGTGNGNTDNGDSSDKNQSSNSGEDQNDDPAYDDNWLPRA